MSRIRDAWLALTGRVEAREVLPEVAMVKAYLVTDWSMAGTFLFAEARRHYATCVQAYASEPGRQVEEVQLLRVGNELYGLPKGLKLYPVALQPKPKRAKGKRT